MGGSYFTSVSAAVRQGYKYNSSHSIASPDDRDQIQLALSTGVK